jgi:hypothetical protein
MQEVFDKLTEYTLALREGLDTTLQASERPLIRDHLAAAAGMYARLHATAEISAIRELVQSEGRAHGRSFMSGQPGERIAATWAAFADEIGLGQQDPAS